MIVKINSLEEMCDLMCDNTIPEEEKAMNDLISLYIRDKCSNVIRRVGDNPHDMLTINDEGQLCYFNLQNGDGCRLGRDPEIYDDSGYEFVPNEDDYGYNCDPREE